MRQSATITVSLPVVIELGPPVPAPTLGLRIGPVRERRPHIDHGGQVVPAIEITPKEQP